MMGLQKRLAACGGDTWCTRKQFAIWFWPLVAIGTKGAPGDLFTEDDYQCFTQFLQPGDFVLTRSEGFLLSNSAIQGSFKHLAVYVGAVSGRKNRALVSIEKPQAMQSDAPLLRQTDHYFKGICKRSFCHAVSEGVLCQHILSVFKHTDYACIVRPWKTVGQQRAIVRRALELVGVGYNFDFSSRGKPEETYCTELGAKCLDVAGILRPPTDLCRISLLGRKGPVYLADRFIEHFGMVACTVSCSDPWFYRQSPIGDLMRTRIKEAEDAGE